MNQNIRNIFIKSTVADEYDNYYQKEPGKTIDKIEKELILRHMNNLPKSHLLELGCGTGHWTQFLSDMGFRITAVDNSEAMLKNARKKNIQNVQFLLADATRLPFSEKSFSAIVSVTMLEFIKDIDRVLDEIDRVLKPEGTIVLGCLNALSELGKIKNSDPVFKHARFFTLEEANEILSRFGNPISMKGVYLSPSFEILDGTENESAVEPAFIAISAKKKNKIP